MDTTKIKLISVITSNLTRLNLTYKFILLFLCLGFTPTSYATADSAVASVQSTSLQVGDVIDFKVHVTGDASQGDLDISPLKDNFTLGALSYSYGSYYSNGEHTTNREWSVPISPKTKGKLTIPSLTINGAKTSPISLTVSDNPTAKEDSNLVTIKNHLSTKKIYPKTTAILTSTLMVKTDPRMIKNAELAMPEGDGLIIKPLSDEPRAYQRMINGVKTTLFEYKYQVMSTKPGNYKLTPLGLSGVLNRYDARRRTRSTLPLNIQGDAINIDVSDIPAGYTGTWLPTDELSLTQTWQDASGKAINDVAPSTTANTTDANTDNTTTIETKVGQPITRTITMTVNNLSTDVLPELNIDYPSTIRAYSEKPTFTNNGSTSTMVLKQVLIPKHTGTVTLPNVTVPWWNTVTEKADKASLNGLTLTVAVDENAPVQSNQSANGSNSTQAQPTLTTENNAISSHNDDLTKTARDLENSHQSTNYWIYISALLALCWLITLIAYFSVRQHVKRLNTSSNIGGNSQGNTTKTNPADLAINLNSSSNSQALITLLGQTVNSDSGASIQVALTRWRQAHPNLSMEDNEALQHEMATLMASLYGKVGSDYNSAVLIALIKKIDKTYQKSGTDSSTILPRL